MKHTIIQYPAGSNELLVLEFDSDGRCTARSRDNITVLSNYMPASDVAALGARIYPADERDLIIALRGLAEWRIYLERKLDIPWATKLSAEARQRRKDWQRGIERINAEIRRLNSNDTLVK